MGTITSIQRFSLHDGPGIRTTVFLKGCNMKCQWCHNPETISFEKQILFHPEKCIHCGMCEEGCFSGARTICGMEMSPEEVINEVLKDMAYYGTDGGLTVSGGEPGCQYRFTKDILELAKKNGISTAVETNMNYKPFILEELMENTDLIMADLKLYDSTAHKLYTGVGNELIKENLKSVNVPLILRTPVIAGVNDTIEEINNIAEFAGTLKTLVYYEMLPYHSLGLSKGAGEQKQFSAPDKKQLQKLREIAEKWCTEVRIAGKKEI